VGKLPTVRNGYQVLRDAFKETTGDENGQKLMRERGDLLKHFCTKPWDHDFEADFGNLVPEVDTIDVSFKVDDNLWKQLHAALGLPDDQAAVNIHRLLDGLTPSQAADRGVWHYMSMVKLLHRVLNGYGKDPSDPTEKISSDVVFGRWARDFVGKEWWWAQFTYDPDPMNEAQKYKFTEITDSRFRLQVIDQQTVSGCRPLIHLLCQDKLDNKSQLVGKKIDAVFAGIRSRTSMMVLDVMSKEQLRKLIDEVCDEVE